MEGRSELQLLEEEWRKAKRREILERLNSYQADISEDDRRREETLRRELKLLLVLLQGFESFGSGAAEGTAGVDPEDRLQVAACFGAFS